MHYSVINVIQSFARKSERVYDSVSVRACTYTKINHITDQITTIQVMQHRSAESAIQITEKLHLPRQNFLPRNQRFQCVRDTKMLCF